jgi:predicted molibdopterin-dependent oxidoreductase YjgC
MQTVELFIDGRPVAVPAGTSLLAAARASGAEIPTLCDHPDLAPHGGCRLCLVETEGSEKLFASCVTPASAGMKVLTDTPRVRAARAVMLELILAYHPLECPVCPQAGRCSLQDAVFRYGLGEGRFVSAPVRRGVDRVSPLIENNQDRCILCSRCVRTCDEVEAEGHLTFSGRGFPTTVATAFNHSWDCEFCGQCFQACPVGALYSRPFAHTAPLWELEPVETSCPFCGVGCDLSALTRGGRIHLVMGASAGINRGRLCSRGRFGYQLATASGRLTTPLARVEGKLVPVSWEEALSRAAAGIRAALAERGPAGVGGIVSPLAVNEDALAFVRLVRDTLGSANIDSVSSAQHLPAALALRDAFGEPASTITLVSLEKSDLVFAVEANLTEDSHVASLELMRRARAGKARLLVAHGRGIKLARFAHQRLRPRPGRAAALLHAITAAVLEEGLEDRAFCETRLSGLSELRASLTPHSPDQAAGTTGVPAADIRAAARAIAGASSAAIVLAPGSGSPFAPGETARAAANLALVTGHCGRAGAGVLLLSEYANSHGVLESGAMPQEDKGAGKGMGAQEMMEAAAGGRLGALLLMGEDVLRSLPGRGLVEKALDAVPFLAVSESFLSQTGERAHVVFPAAGAMEREGTATTADRRTRAVRPAVSPPGQARQDSWIWSALAAALGAGSGARAAAAAPPPVESSAAVLALAEGWTGRLRPAAPVPPAGKTDPARPFLLVTGTVRHHCGSALTRGIELAKLTPEAVAELSPTDAGRLGVKEGDRVRITSVAGSLTVKARPDARNQPGTVFLPVHFPDAPWNELVDAAAAALGMPVPVTVEKVS